MRKVGRRSKEERDYNNSYYLRKRKDEPRFLSQIKENNRNLRKRNKEFIKNYLKDKSCIDCGNSDIRVLEFDHVSGIKFTEVSKMVRTGFSIKRILEEISKCEIRCCNCHRIITIERREKG